MKPLTLTITLSTVISISLGSLGYYAYQKIEDERAIAALETLGPCNGTQPSHSDFRKALAIVQKWDGLNRHGQRIALTRVEILRRKILGCLS